MSNSVTKGAHHIGLTVPDIEKTGTFFRDILGYKQVGEKPDYPAVFLSDGNIMITLWQVADPATAAPFDRRTVIGLHHLALKVDGRESLDSLHSALATHDEVDVEFAPEHLGDGPTAHMMCVIPGGIRVEFIAPGG
ncbi:MAG: VOC family protein [Gammaproteobacteria bacterium]|nr:VOC family protein [Gammaproteobacteria bacterium]MCZ6855572.1 VOC family protein [Gammaproteobacteria bacterium]